MTSTKTVCVRCSAPTPDGALICGPDTRRVRDQLATWPGLLGDLLVNYRRAESRTPGRAGVDVPLPFDERAAQLRAEMTALVAPYGGLGALLSRLDQVRHEPGAGRLVDDVDRLTAAAERAVVRNPADTWWWGRCRPGICEVDLYGTPGDGSVRCPSCAVLHATGPRRLLQLEAARDQLVSARLAAGFVALVHRVDESRLYANIRKWAERDRLPTKPGARGPLYRIGDVEDLVLVDAEQQARKATLNRAARRRVETAGRGAA